MKVRQFLFFPISYRKGCDILCGQGEVACDAKTGRWRKGLKSGIYHCFITVGRFYKNLRLIQFNRF